MLRWLLTVYGRKNKTKKTHNKQKWNTHTYVQNMIFSNKKIPRRNEKWATVFDAKTKYSQIFCEFVDFNGIFNVVVCYRKSPNNRQTHCISLIKQIIVFNRTGFSLWNDIETKWRIRWKLECILAFKKKRNVFVENGEKKRKTIEIPSILTPNANGISHSKAVRIYVKNRFAWIVLRKQRRSLQNKKKTVAFNSTIPGRSI